MGEDLWFITCMAAVLAVSAAGAKIPALIGATDRRIHLMISFSAGIFLGVLFLVLIPEAFEEAESSGRDAHEVMYVMLAGFLGILLFDFAYKHRGGQGCGCSQCADARSHDVASLSAFAGLAIHACFDGVALAAAFSVGGEAGAAVIAAVCVHKLVEAFALSSAFMLSSRKKRSARYLAAFCLATPLAGAAAYMFMRGAEAEATWIAFAASAGIFAFVTLMDMLPEAFHRRETDVRSLLLLLAGLAAVVAMALMAAAAGGHAH
ncbi:MAG: ZIP family metal transporter [Candidatus Methanoplasma sp.]|jgi:zinc transporter ZupT|nr:ZIP family metal transporter [Candidatus Methanoplasma sp.]